LRVVVVVVFEGVWLPRGIVGAWLSG
jgi:hypothetical protein